MLTSEGKGGSAFVEACFGDFHLARVGQVGGQPLTGGRTPDEVAKIIFAEEWKHPKAVRALRDTTASV